MSRTLVNSSIVALAIAMTCRTAAAGDNNMAGVHTCPSSFLCGAANTERQFQAEGPGVFFSKLFDTSGFPDRWHCGTWSSDVGWLHIISDLTIFLAYLAIPVVLTFFLLRRRDVPFLGVFWLFAAFIVACGFGHLFEAGAFWWPAYRFTGLLKALTATISLGTVVALIFVTPKALALPGVAALNTRLQAEVDERRAAQDRLQRSHDELAQFTNSVLDREDRNSDVKRESNRLVGDRGRTNNYPMQDATA